MTEVSQVSQAWELWINSCSVHGTHGISGGTPISGCPAQPNSLSAMPRQTAAEGPASGNGGRGEGQSDPPPVLTKWDRAQFGRYEKGGCTLLSAVTT